MSDSFDLKKMLQNKREMRRDLASRPIAEKLAMLNALRERSLALRAATPRPQVLEAAACEVRAGLHRPQAPTSADSR
jgi:hypothetical protein